MSTLHVEFQEGWTGEPVDLVVNGEVRHHGSPRTRLQIGFAESVSVEVDEKADVQLTLPDGTQAEVRRSASADELWLGLSKQDDGSLHVVEQRSPFGYV